jgi:hypothetical protein
MASAAPEVGEARGLHGVMIFLSGCVCEELMGRPEFGFMVTPRMGHILPATQVWAADTACYTEGDTFNLVRYLQWLERRPAASCLFATCPDVVGDWKATLERSWKVPIRLRMLGYKPAIVAQDGATPDTVPWDDIDALFIGGTTEWKMEDPVVIALLDEAGRRGKWKHLGRINSGDKMIIAATRGCDSVDGTFLTFGKDLNMGRLLGWMELVNRQQSFF